MRKPGFYWVKLGFNNGKESRPFILESNDLGYWIGDYDEQGFTGIVGPIELPKGWEIHD